MTKKKLEAAREALELLQNRIATRDRKTPGQLPQLPITVDDLIQWKMEITDLGTPLVNKKIKTGNIAIGETNSLLNEQREMMDNIPVTIWRGLKMLCLTLL